MLALCTAEHDHEGRGGFTVEANLDHVITNVVPDGILRLLGHARDGGGGVADPEALYIGPICLDDMTNNFCVLDATSREVAYKLEKMSPEQNRRFFNIVQDYTLEELEEVWLNHEWAFI
ncbi:hypothetical protein CDL15_Pgr020818 [Punica granatum]|uniref:SKP1 component dimerisation domain-containing protein n=1 Tax=Punica granatum TaxID=22663 RepID=A0A218XV81_PUNGR|nr:hypothetical protein CDL15_Pgr020818 [Punica granatum]